MSLRSLLQLTAAWAVAVVTQAAQADLLVSSYTTHRVLRFDESTGAYLGDFVTAGSGGLIAPTGLAFGPDGNLYVGSLVDSVLRYDSRTGSFIDVFVEPGSGGLDGAEDIRFGSDGFLYVVSRRNGSLLRYDAATGVPDPSFQADGGNLDEPMGVVFSATGDLLVTSRYDARVARFDRASGAYLGDLVAAGSNGLSLAYGMTFMPEGDLLVASGASNEVLRFDSSTGEFIGVFSVFASGTGIDTPVDIEFGPDGLLYASSAPMEAVHRFDGITGAFVDVFVDAPEADLDWPTFLAFTREVSCRTGNVNAATGLPMNVLFANGSPGIGAERVISISSTDPLAVFVDRPASRPTGPVAFALYAWVGRPTVATVDTLPFGVGVTCMPTPVSGGMEPRPKATWNSIGLTGALGTPTRSSPKAPAVALRLPRGVGRMGTFFLQGIILDPASPSGQAAVTNGIVIVSE